MMNWSRYLESLRTTYAQWWQVYTITDVVGQKREEAEPSPLLFDFGQMVQTVERDREEKGKGKEKIERLSVLEGLRKYASEHVLLVGRPGSGKSTALVRLLLEEAEKARTPLNPPLLREEDFSTGSQVKGEASGITPLSPPLPRGEEKPPLALPLVSGEEKPPLAPPLIRGAGGVKIPVLVELRYYRTSILDLIQDFLQRHDPNLTIDTETLKTWLRQGQLLLLVDGLNELASEEARRDLQKFRQDYQKTTPMIFTTRDLGVGGDLDITKKLEMQPLSEAQMQQFVRAYLPQQEEQMLRQLGSRLEEFGQTPLLLWMLCSLFKAIGKVPPNFGLVFRQFVLSYEGKLKQDVPISGESRRWGHRLLEQLAWVMTCGEEKTELQVAISRQKAEAVLTECLRGKVAHPEDCALRCLEDLLKHHLIQLGANNQIEFRHQLIQEYYTAESLLKLLLKLSDDELKRDYLNYLKWTEPLALMLELVEDEAQVLRVVRLGLEVDLRLGARLAGAVKPELQEQTVGLVVELDVPQLLKIQLLGLTKSERAIPSLIKALINGNYIVRRRVFSALDNQSNADVIFKIQQRLKYYNPSFRKEKSILTHVSISQSIQSHEKYTDVLEKIDSEVAVPALRQVLADPDFRVRMNAVKALAETGSDLAISILVQALSDEAVEVRSSAAAALGQIGSDTAVPDLLKALSDETVEVRSSAATALGQIGSDTAVPDLLKALSDEAVEVRSSAAAALGQIGSDLAISVLVQALSDEAVEVRSSAAAALGQIGSDTAVPDLIKALSDSNFNVRANAAEAIGQVSNLAHDLAETAETIEKLLDQLAQVDPTATDLEKQLMAAQSVKRHPTMRARLVRAMKAGGVEALKQMIGHPMTNILIEALKAENSTKK